MLKNYKLTIILPLFGRDELTKVWIAENYNSKYKYIIVFEPDIVLGLVTKDIFSSFFAKSIPIYLGASNITRFISDETFIKYDIKNPLRTLTQIKIINANERIYNNIVSYS